MSPNSTVPSAVSQPAPAITPLSSRAAVTILGSMLLLIAVLTVVLVETTWAAPETSIETPAPAFTSPPDLAQR